MTSPSPHPEMTKDQKVKMMQWLQDHWPEKTCPICHETNWNVDPSIWMLPSLKGKTVNFSSAFPAVIAMCSNCGYLNFFSAMRAELMDETAGKKEVSDG